MRQFATALVFALGVSSGIAAEPSLRKTAAELLDKRGPTLAAVKFTVVHRTLIEKKEVHKAEHAVEATGTVIRADGTLVAAASALDFLPSLPAAPPIEIEELTTEFKTQGVRIRYGNGREVPAQLIGRDAARDLAFFKPLEKPGDIRFLALDSPAAKFAAAQPIVVLYPLTHRLAHRPAVAIRSIAAIIEKSGNLPVLDTSELRHLGCPVFAADGQFGGIATTVRPPQKPHEYLGNFENNEPDIVVRAPADIATSLHELERTAPK